MQDFLKFIGIGSAFNPTMGNTSAFFYTDNGKTFNLIDCGSTVFQRIIEMELLNNVKKVNVFITHNHSDHIGSLSTLVEYCFYIMKIKANLYDFNLKLSSIPSLLSSLDNELNMYTLNKDIDEGSNSLKLGDRITVSSFKVDHKPKLLSSAYEFTVDDKIYIYTGDHNDARITDDYFTLYGYNAIFTDCSIHDFSGNPHVSIKQLCRRFAKPQRSKVYCMHVESEEAIDIIKSNGFNCVEIFNK